MIKGLIALFSSGIIFRLPILIGIVIGIVMMVSLSDEQIWAVFRNPLLYFFGLLVSFLYAFLLKRVYYKGGTIVDWRATFYSVFGHFISYVAAVIFSCLFVFTVSLGGFDNEDEKNDAELTPAQAQELMQQLQKMAK